MSLNIIHFFCLGSFLNCRIFRRDCSEDFLPDRKFSRSNYFQEIFNPRFIMINVPIHCISLRILCLNIYCYFIFL